MKQTLLFKTLIAITTVFMGAFMLTTPAMAAGTTPTTSFTINEKKTNVSIKDLAIEVIKFLSIGVGIAVVGGIAAGGVVYSTSQGNPAGTQKGITIITNSIVGLMLYLLMFSMLQFLIPGGILQ